MNKKILLALGVIIGVTVAIIPLAFLGLPFPSGNPDGFEKATFEDSRVGEPEASVLPGIDLGPFGDLLLGPMGILLAFVLTIGLLYLIQKIPGTVKQPKLIVFAIFVVVLISLLVVPLTIASTEIKWKSSIEANSDKVWTFTMEHVSLTGMKYGIENVNGNITITMEFMFAGLTQVFEMSCDSGEVSYYASTKYFTSEGPTYTFKLAANEPTITMELTPSEKTTYTLEVTGNQMVFTAEMTSNNMKYSIEQSSSGIAYAIGMDL
ncbi:MAG: hypothetical protein ACTSRG_20970 [Candidatus Helarchaeota archaeon]